MVKKRDLTPEEEKLWKQVASGATRIDSAHAEAKRPVERRKRLRKKEEEAPAPKIPARAIANMPELSRGQYAGVDRNTAERFRKGEYPIDATLDLHGMSRERAQRALAAFLNTQFTRGSRCLLVITGKGMRKNALAEPERGILREMLPQWLGEPELRPLVLAFDVARAKHGGSGAYYVLLKRQR